MKKFTFKKYVATGMYRSFEKDQTDIKLNKMVVGSVGETCYGYKIRFAVKKDATKEDPAPFKWVSFKTRYTTENDARQFVKDNNKVIQNQLDLHLFDD